MHLQISYCLDQQQTSLQIQNFCSPFYLQNIGKLIFCGYYFARLDTSHVFNRSNIIKSLCGVITLSLPVYTCI